MVIFFEWHRTAMDQKICSGLPMTGEDTGLGALASPLAGYLGKVQERAGSLENCPWCTAKGLTYALRSYRINLQESITLCTNPQCLFPLVSRSLEDVLASLNPVEPTVGNKRKKSLVLENDEFINHAAKRLRSSELEGPGQQSFTDALNNQAERGAVNTVSDGQHAAHKRDGEKVNGCHKDSSVALSTRWESLRDDDSVLDTEAESTACTDGACSASAGHLQGSSEALLNADGDEPAVSPRHGSVRITEVEGDCGQVKSPSEVLNRLCSTDSDQSSLSNEDIHMKSEINTPSPLHNEQTAGTGQKSLTADINTSKAKGVESESKDLSSATITQPEELVRVPDQLFWRNSDNLCWLDSLLVALVNCRSLRKYKPKDEAQRSAICQLMRGYEDVCAAIRVHQQNGRDGSMKVPNHVLQKANADLQNLRMSIFKLLQPKLQCKLGQRETPVFAMPLLLTLDSWAAPLFQSTFHWEFKCSECKTATKERVMKTLPTFTNILPDWRPLRAVHLAPCNVCCEKNQRRMMVMERLPPVFGLHFVEGLPDNDVRIYTFTFEGKRYSVTTVIQYNQQLKHFVTWISNSDGSWREYDDLKHPECKTHQKLPVRAQEMHVVFWEAEEDEEPRSCSPSSTFSESTPSKVETNPSLGENDLLADELPACTPDQSLLVSPNTTDIVCALSEDSIMDTTVTDNADASIGSTTLLDTFEGLSSNDIITLTLVEIKPDSETTWPLNDKEQTLDLSVPSKSEIFDSAPDSSSAVISSKTSPSVDVELPTTSNSSESDDGSSSDPTFVPGGQGRAKRNPIRGKLGKNTDSSKAPPLILPPASSEPSKEIGKKPVVAVTQDDTPPVETTQRAPPVCATDVSPPSTCQKSPAAVRSLDQNARWSFLLSKHPLQQLNFNFKPGPTQIPPVKPSPPTHSTPNPIRKQQGFGGIYPKTQLKTEHNEALPPKAAEMYGAFAPKRSNAPSPASSPALTNGKSQSLQLITSHHQKSLTSVPEPGVKRPADIPSSKFRTDLSDTDALRYKLLKKLKAKKKKLAKLNEMLGHQGGASLRPDSTDLDSPNTVTSSTYDGSISDDLLSDLLSPATTASNLSPDSTGFLEMLASGPDGADQSNVAVGAMGAVSRMKTCENEPSAENFLDDFLSQAAAQRPTEMETEALSALELFV